jgi:hypothetical protein
LTPRTKSENLQGNKTGIRLNWRDKEIDMREIVQDMTSAAVIIGFITTALILGAAFIG